jgi:hypothetical protein
VTASRFPGYRPIAVVEIGRSQLGVNFRIPVSRKPSVRSASNFGSLLPWPSPFVWHRSDVDPTFGFRVGEGAPKFSTSPNSGTDGDFVAPSSDFGSYGGPGRFCQVWRPSLDRKGFVRGVVNFSFAFWRRVPMTGCRPFDPFAESEVGGVDRGPSATHVSGFLRAPRWLSPAVGPLAPIASCGRRVGIDALLPVIIRPKNLNFCGRGAPPGPPPRRFDVGRLPRRPSAIPVFGRRLEPFRRGSAAIFRPIFAFCGARKSVSTLGGRPGAESTAPFDRATPTFYGSPFDSERLRCAVFEISRSKGSKGDVLTDRALAYDGAR